LRVGVGEAICHDVEPRVELVIAGRPDLDSGWRDSYVPIAGSTRWASSICTAVPQAVKDRSTSSRAAALGTPPKPSPATLLSGEPSSAKLATSPAIWITKPAVSALRRWAASLPLAMSCASLARCARPGGCCRTGPIGRRHCPRVCRSFPSVVAVDHRGEVHPQRSHDEDGVQAGEDLGGVAVFSRGTGSLVAGPPPVLRPNFLVTLRGGIATERIESSSATPHPALGLGEDGLSIEEDSLCT
jgi:hypothetical protein